MFAVGAFCLCVFEHHAATDVSEIYVRPWVRKNPEELANSWRCTRTLIIEKPVTIDNQMTRKSLVRFSENQRGIVQGVLATPSESSMIHCPSWSNTRAVY
jgi:hypothetical protein